MDSTTETTTQFVGVLDEPAAPAADQAGKPGDRAAFVPALTGVRAIAALWVLLFHFRPELVSMFPFLGHFAPIFDTGYLGVDLFFVLSGFILTFTHLDRMTGPWDIRRALGFLWLRLSRIWPVMFLVLLGWVLYHSYEVVANRDASIEPWLSPARFLAHAALLQGWWVDPTDQYNPVDWSLSAEWLAYIAFAFAVVVLAKLLVQVRSRTLVLLSLISIFPIVAVGVTMEDGSDLLLYHNAVVPGQIQLRVLCEFFAGAFVALLVMRHGSKARLPWFLRPTMVVAVAVALIFLVAAYDPFRRYNLNLDWRINGHMMWGSAETVIIVPLFLLLVGGLAIGARDPLAALLRTRVLVWGGKVSFALYLIHWLIIDAMRHVINNKLHLAPLTWEYRLIVLGCIGLAVLIAWILYRFFEEPTRRAMRTMLPASMKA